MNKANKSVIFWLWKAYRVGATGFCFLVFMVSGLLCSLTLAPLIQVLPLPRRRRARLSLGLIRLCFYLFTQLMRGLRVLKRFEVLNRERFRDGGPYLIVANHPSLIDVVTLLGQVPRCNCIVKGALFQHPFMGGVLRRAGLLSADFGMELLDLVQENFACGYSLLVFPEGTRSPLDGIHPFNRGAAQLAVRMNVPILPVLISCDPPTLRKGQAWYEVPDRAVSFRLEVATPIHPQAVIEAGQDMPRQVRALNRYMEAYFRQALQLQKVNAPPGEASAISAG